MHATKNIEVKFHFVLEINCMSYLWVIDLSVLFWPKFRGFFSHFFEFLKFFKLKDSRWRFQNIVVQSWFVFEINCLSCIWVNYLLVRFLLNFEGFWPFFQIFFKFFVQLFQDECLKNLRPCPYKYFRSVVLEKILSFLVYGCFHQKTKMRCMKWADFPTLKIHNSWSVRPTASSQFVHITETLHFQPRYQRKAWKWKKWSYIRYSQNIAFCRFLKVQIHAHTDRTWG